MPTQKLAPSERGDHATPLLPTPSHRNPTGAPLPQRHHAPLPPFERKDGEQCSSDGEGESEKARHEGGKQRPAEVHHN